MEDNQDLLKQTTAIILAAGKGTRINATKDKNKVTYALGGKPMVSYSVSNLKKSGIQKIYVVVGYAKESVKDIFKDTVSYVEQDKRKGTGHAVKSALKHVSADFNTILVMYGDDSAFYPPKLFKQLVFSHHQKGALVSVLTVEVENPFGLGRIIRQNDKVIGIVEEKNANPEQKEICEINTGLYCFNAAYLRSAINDIQKNPVSGEYYLTDIIEIAHNQDKSINALKWPDSRVWCGVNTPEQLKVAIRRMKILQQE